MLAEAFLQAMVYRSTSDATLHRLTTFPDGPEGGAPSLTRPNSTEARISSAAAGPNQEEKGPPQTHRPWVETPPLGLVIPGCSPGLPLDSNLGVCIDDCSLLVQYPDLTVADSGRVYALPQEPPRDPAPPLSDQGYLVMGASVDESLDLSESRLEPMSNSVLNGLLERQLEEVYLQHLTDNLARCNSHLGNSLLHDLVPPPQLHGPDSPEPSLQVRSGEDDRKEASDLSIQNVPCSSTFSSPVLRISEAEQTQSLKWK